MSTSKPFSSEQVPRTLTNSIVIEQEQNRTERIENRYGMEMDTEQIKKQEQESTWDGNRAHSVKHSLIGFLLISTVHVQPVNYFKTLF